jgi:hypothetical protein
MLAFVLFTAGMQIIASAQTFVSHFEVSIRTLIGES